MVGVLELASRQKGRKSMELEERRVLGARFLCAIVAETPGLTKKRRLTRAVRQLEKQGVTALIGAGSGSLPAVDTLPLARELAAQLAEREMCRRGISGSSAQAAVFAAAPSGELVRIVTELALRCRYLLLELPWGGEDLCRALRREYGVAIQLNPGREAMAAADVTVLWDRPDWSPQHGLPLYPEGGITLPELALPPALETQLPPGWDRPTLLAALRQAGILRPGQITLAKGGNP